MLQYSDDAKFTRYVKELDVWTKVPGFESMREDLADEFDRCRRELGI